MDKKKKVSITVELKGFHLRKLEAYILFGKLLIHKVHHSISKALMFPFYMKSLKSQDLSHVGDNNMVSRMLAL